jgi:starvation-inducible DNA-binding protein
MKMETAHGNTGIGETERQKIAHDLTRLLADSYLLYVKTQGVHWNVTGPMFASLHVLLEKQYEELASAVDEVAERVRALGERAPAGLREFTSLMSLGDDELNGSCERALGWLAEAHDACAKRARELFKQAEEANDQATCDLLAGRMGAHEKASWMLRSHLT